jgi:hypothetical protein
METANMAIALEINHWYQQHLANTVVNTVTGKQIEYMALMNDPDLQPLWKRGFSSEAAAFFKASATSQELTHVYLCSLKTYQKTERLHMEK